MAEETGGVSKKMRSDYFFRWVYPYFDDRDLEEIVRAHGNLGKQLTVLDRAFEKAQLPESFTDDIYFNERRQLIEKLEQKFSVEGSAVMDKVERERMGIKEEPEPEPTYKEGKYVTQKSASGKEYKRSFHKWTPKEKAYLKEHLIDYKEGRISKTQFRIGLKNQSGNERSQSSVDTKVRRVNKHGLGKTREEE